MIFTRVLHDGLYAVINRQGKAKIVFTNGEFHTEDPEQCAYLAELGYKNDGKFPKQAEEKAAPKKAKKKAAPKKESKKAE